MSGWPVVDLPTHALTLWPEWAYAIAHLRKNVENRSWRPPAWLVGQRLAIHAGANIGGRAGRRAFEEGVERLHAMMLSLTAEELEAMPRTTPRMIQGSTRRIVAVVTVGEPTRDSASPWAVPGEWHWPLTDVVSVDVPVHQGRQGLWRLTDEQQEALAEQLEATRGG